MSSQIATTRSEADRPRPSTPQVAVKLEGVVKHFGGEQGRRVGQSTAERAGDAVVAVAGIDLEIYDGEFF